MKARATTKSHLEQGIAHNPAGQKNQTIKHGF